MSIRTNWQSTGNKVLHIEIDGITTLDTLESQLQQCMWMAKGERFDVICDLSNADRSIRAGIRLMPEILNGNGRFVIITQEFNIMSLLSKAEGTYRQFGWELAVISQIECAQRVLNVMDAIHNEILTTRSCPA